MDEKNLKKSSSTEAHVAQVRAHSASNTNDSQLKTSPQAAISQFIKIQKTVTERVTSSSVTIDIKQFLQLVNISS